MCHGRRAGRGHGDMKAQIPSVSPPSTTQPSRLGRTQQPFLAFRPAKHQQLSAFGMGLSAHSPFGDSSLGVSKHPKIPSSLLCILIHIGTHQSSAPAARGAGARRDLTQHRSSPGDAGHGAGDPRRSLSSFCGHIPAVLPGLQQDSVPWSRGRTPRWVGSLCRSIHPLRQGKPCSLLGRAGGWGPLSASAWGSGSGGELSAMKAKPRGSRVSPAGSSSPGRGRAAGARIGAGIHRHSPPRAAPFVAHTEAPTSENLEMIRIDPQKSTRNPTHKSKRCLNTAKRLPLILFSFSKNFYFSLSR